MGTAPETRAVRLPRSDEPFFDQHAEHERRRLQELHQDATGEGAAEELSRDGEESGIPYLEKDAQRFRARVTSPPGPARPPIDTGRT